MPANDVSTWDKDVQIFFQNAFLVLERHKVANGVYGLKMEFWKIRLTDEDRLSAIFERTCSG